MAETMARKEDGQVSLTEIVVTKIQLAQDGKKQECLFTLTQEVDKEIKVVQEKIDEWGQATDKTLAFVERKNFSAEIKDFLGSGLRQKIKEKQALLATIILVTKNPPSVISTIDEMAKLPELSTVFVYEITQIRSALVEILNLQDFIAEGYKLFLQKKADLAVGLTQNSIRHFLSFLIDLSRPKHSMYVEMFSSLLESMGGSINEEESAMEIKVDPVGDFDGTEENFSPEFLQLNDLDDQPNPFQKTGRFNMFPSLKQPVQDFLLTVDDQAGDGLGAKKTEGQESSGNENFRLEGEGFPEFNEEEFLFQKYLELKAAKYGLQNTPELLGCRKFVHEVLYKIADAQNKSGPGVSRECFLGNGNPKAFSSDKVNRANNLVARKLVVHPKDEEKIKLLAFVKANIRVLCKVDNLSIDIPEKSDSAVSDGDGNNPSPQFNSDLDKKSDPSAIQKKRKKGSVIIDWDNFDEICEQEGTDRSKAKALGISNSYFCTLKQKRHLKENQEATKLSDAKKIDLPETASFTHNDEIDRGITPDQDETEEVFTLSENFLADSQGEVKAEVLLKDNGIEVTGNLVIIDQSGQAVNNIQITETVEVFERDGRFRPEIPGASRSDGQTELENDPDDYVVIHKGAEAAKDAEGAKERAASRGNGAVVENFPGEDEVDYIEIEDGDDYTLEAIKDDDFYVEEEDFSKDQFPQKERKKEPLLSRCLQATLDNDAKTIRRGFEKIAEIRGLSLNDLAKEIEKKGWGLTKNQAKHLVDGNNGGIDDLTQKQKESLRFYFIDQLSSK